MSSLTSASTLAQIEAAYDDNASYAEDNSASKAKAFVTACRLLIRRYPKMSAGERSSLALSPDLIQKEMADAQEWLATHDTSDTAVDGPRVTRVDLRDTR
jgi:hypothetical protein